MKASRAQIALISILNVVIIALVAALLFVPSGPGEPASGENVAPPEVRPDDPPAAPAHEKLRDASPGRTDKIVRETRLMGLGDETAVKVYFRDGVAYIFGNATVKGLDFDERGGFLCIVNARGRIMSYTYFDGNIGAVGAIGGGYAVCAADRLYFVDYAGDAALRARTDGDGVNVHAVEGDRIAVVTQPNEKALKLTEYMAIGDEWSAGHSTRIDSGYALRFFDCYDFDGKYVISARAYYRPVYDAAVFFCFAAGGDASAHYYGGTGDALTRPYAVMPCAAGYFALASVNGMATVITVDFGFVSYHSVNLGFAFTDATLCFLNGKYYACFDRIDGAVTYELESDLSRRRLTEADGLKTDCAFSAGAATLAGTCAAGAGEEPIAALISPYVGGRVTLELKNATFYGGTKNADGVTVVFSAAGGGDVSEPTAGKDIYIVTLEG